MVYWILAICASVIGIWAGYTQFYEGGLGQPNYKILQHHHGVEFRHYEPFITASTQPNQSGRPGLRTGFRVLANYIFGGNKPGESLAMTAPVLQQDGTDETLSMTTSLLTSNEGMTMAFVMPCDKALQDLPTPNNSSIQLTQVDWGDVVAIRFSGHGKQHRFQSKEEELRRILASSQFEPIGPAVYAQYNSPRAFPPLRRNEVLIPIAAPSRE